MEMIRINNTLAEDCIFTSRSMKPPPLNLEGKLWYSPQPPPQWLRGACKILQLVFSAFPSSSYPACVPLIGTSHATLEEEREDMMVLVAVLYVRWHFEKRTIGENASFRRACVWVKYRSKNFFDAMNHPSGKTVHSRGLLPIGIGRPS